MTSHKTDIRVYYEDTDAGGIVYYANYLKFAERARSEWLRSKGVENQKLAEQEGIYFVVKSCSIDYLRPAQLDDMICVHTKVDEIKSASITLNQDIYRGDEKLVSITVKLCLINEAKRPVKISNELKEKLA